jgi:predicted dehydrogenase
MAVSTQAPASVPGLSRRRFLYCSAVAAGGGAFNLYANPQPRRLSASDKLNLAVIGVSGKGFSDLNHCTSENIIALCDVDDQAAVPARKQYPKAKFYKDFRKLLEQEKFLDAVVIATPDHLHGTMASTAMRLGKHVYCQKPLTHTIYEARLLRQLAKEHNVATQMGNQGSAEEGLRRAVEVVQAGLIGPVRQVYVWSNRPIWPQGMDRPAGQDPVPATFDWDLWLGPAPWRPFKFEHTLAAPSKAGTQGKSDGGSGVRVYHPFNWRGWQDFGTGAMGDMACHTVNMPFRALKLGYPVEVEAACSSVNKETYPLKSRIRFEFPAREGQPPVTLWWFDGGNPRPDNPYVHDCSNKPPKEVTADVQELLDKVPDSGCLLLGDKGTIFSPDDYNTQFFVKLKAEKDFTDAKAHQGVKAIPQVIPRNTFGDKTGDLRHHLEWMARNAIKGKSWDLLHLLEWVMACKGGKPAYSNFDTSAYLTEIVLLGCLAMQVGRKLEWDGPNMRATNAPEADYLIRREPRKGWTL